MAVNEMDGRIRLLNWPQHLLGPIRIRILFLRKSFSSASH